MDLGALRGPHGLAFAAGKVYFTAEVNKVIGRYDPSTGKVDWVLGTGQNRTHMILVSKDRGQIFTSNVNSATISVIEKSTGPAGGPGTGGPGEPRNQGGPPSPSPNRRPGDRKRFGSRRLERSGHRGGSRLRRL